MYLSVGVCLATCNSAVPIGLGLPLTLDFIHPEKHVDERGFAGARPADDADFLSAFDGAIEILEHLDAVAVIEADVHAPDLTWHSGLNL